MPIGISERELGCIGCYGLKKLLEEWGKPRPARSLEGESGKAGKHTISVFLNAAIAAEESHPAHTRDTFLQPFLLVLIRFVNQRMGLDVAIEIVGHEVVVAVIGYTVA